MGRKSFVYPRDLPYGEKVIRADKLFGGKEEDETVGLRFNPEQGLRLGIAILMAAYHKRPLDIKVDKKNPRKDGTYNVTVTAE